MPLSGRSLITLKRGLPITLCMLSKKLTTYAHKAPQEMLIRAGYQPSWHAVPIGRMLQVIGSFGTWGPRMVQNRKTGRLQKDEFRFGPFKRQGQIAG